jgi:hypothetical protein
VAVDPAEIVDSHNLPSLQPDTKHMATRSRNTRQRPNLKAATYYDDNFGHYDIDDEDDVAFYHQVQRESRLKTCQGCGQKVRLRPDYAYCNSCADKREMGMDLEY